MGLSACVVWSLLRLGADQHQWTPNGGVSSSDNSWTGIAGSTDWDVIHEEEVRAVILELGGDPDDVGLANYWSSSRAVNSRFPYYIALSGTLVERVVATSCGVKIPRTGWEQRAEVDLPDNLRQVRLSASSTGRLSGSTC